MSCSHRGAWLTALVAVAVAATVALAPLLPARAQTRLHVKQTAFPSMDNVSVIVAKELGYFDREGLDFEFIASAGGTSGPAALIAGDVQFVNVSVPDAINLKRQGKDVVLFYSLVNAMTLDLVVRREVAEARGVTAQSPLAERFAALKGLRIGVTGPGTITELYPRYYLMQAGLNPDQDAEFVTIGGAPGLVAAFKANRIDAFMLSAPTPYLLEREGAGTVLIKASQGDVPILQDYAFETITATRAFAQEHPEALRGYARAVSAAAYWIPAHRAEAVQIMHDRLFPDSNPEDLALALDVFLPAIRPDGKLTEQAIKNQVEVARALGLIEGEVDTSEGTFWTTQYTE